MKSAMESFTEDRVLAFNAIVGEILPGVFADDPYGHVIKPFSHWSNRTWGYILDAPGGTGKTCTIRSIQSMLRMREQKFTAVATSAVAASLLEGDGTACSLFRLPIPCFFESVCNISLDSKLACTIRLANLIIWDEIVMCVRYCVETIDRTLRAIMNSPNVPFDGKCILFNGDFRQI